MSGRILAEMLAPPDEVKPDKLTVPYAVTTTSELTSNIFIYNAI